MKFVTGGMVAWDSLLLVIVDLSKFLSLMELMILRIQY